MGDPSVIDTEPFEVVEKHQDRIACRREAKLENYSESTFDFRIDRVVELLSTSVAAASLGVSIDGLDLVGYRTSNRVTNTGTSDWKHETGLLSIWILGMYKPGPGVTVVIPYQTGDSASLGSVVNDTYFGEVPSSRLKSGNGVIYFSGDGKLRSKIGVSPQRSTGVCGSYDVLRNILTVVKYNQPGPEVTQYVNSKWELQDAPFSGDAINAYNDGPLNLAPSPSVRFMS